MPIDDIVATILAGVILLTLIVFCIIIFVKYGFNYIELDIKCRKAQIDFYKSAKNYFDFFADAHGDKNVDEQAN